MSEKEKLSKKLKKEYKKKDGGLQFSNYPGYSSEPISRYDKTEKIKKYGGLRESNRPIKIYDKGLKYSPVPMMMDIGKIFKEKAKKKHKGK